MSDATFSNGSFVRDGGNANFFFIHKDGLTLLEMTAADPERGICDDPPCMTILQHTTVIAFSKILFFFNKDYYGQVYKRNRKEIKRLREH